MLAGRSGDANSSDNLFKIEKAKPKRTIEFVAVLGGVAGYPWSYNNDPVMNRVRVRAIPKEKTVNRRLIGSDGVFCRSDDAAGSRGSKGASAS